MTSRKKRPSLADMYGRKTILQLLMAQHGALGLAAVVSGQMD
jgi:hypothetical protein